MSKHTEALAEGFAQEMRKLALGNVGAAAATGATIFGLGNALKRYSASRAEGRGVGESIGEGAKGALIGAGVGGALGGGLAGGAKALRGGQAIEASTPWYKTIDQGIGDFGRRQLHGVFGYVPKGADYGQYVRSIGIGSDAANAVEAAKRNVEMVAKGQSPYRIPVFSKWRADRALSSAQAARDASDALIEHKATSIPGLIRGLAGPNRGKVLGSIAKDQWHGTDALSKAMIAGDAYQLGDTLAHPDRQDPMGRSRGEVVGTSAGRLAGFLVPSSISYGGQLVAGSALGAVGAHVGRALSRPIRSSQSPAPAPLSAEEPSYNAHMSPVASGQSFDGSGQ